jgi:hypothetical protein
MIEVQLGNTMRFEAVFGEDWTADPNTPVVTPTDPQLVRFKVYNSGYKVLDEYTLGSSNRIDTGKYFFNWRPTATGNLVCEWYAEIEGTPSLKRFPVSVKFV